MKLWVTAKAGRKIKLKFGDWEADFRGLSQRQVVKVFQVLHELVAIDNPNRPEYLKHERKRIKQVLKEAGIPAVPLKLAKTQHQRRKFASVTEADIKRAAVSRPQEKATKSSRKKPKDV